jgi:hypothetical protein
MPSRRTQVLRWYVRLADVRVSVGRGAAAACHDSPRLFQLGNPLY